MITFYRLYFTLTFYKTEAQRIWSTLSNIPNLDVYQKLPRKPIKKKGSDGCHPSPTESDWPVHGAQESGYLNVPQVILMQLTQHPSMNWYSGNPDLVLVMRTPRPRTRKWPAHGGIASSRADKNTAKDSAFKVTWLVSDIWTCFP